jgi:hypothetical protein
LLYCDPSYMFRPIYMAIFRLLREEGFYIIVQLYYNFMLCHTKSRTMCTTVVWSLTLSLLMWYIYWASCKARNFNVIYIYMDLRLATLKAVSICCTMFQHWINSEICPVAQLCVNILPATKVTLITDGI